MGIFQIFRAEAEKKLAQQWVEELVNGISPEAMRERRTGLSVNKITRVLEKIYQAAVRHQINTSTGYFKRVALLSAFREEMERRGYPADFVQTAVEGMLMELAKKSRD
jgi:hypothetical protein